MKTVLLADDDENVRQVLREFFAGEAEYRVVAESCDGMGAVEACRRLHPDLALLDIQMPILDGIGAAELICREELAHCVVMLTSFDDRSYVNAAIEAGAFGYLTKPFDAAKIGPTLEVCLARSRERHLLRKSLAGLDKRLDSRQAVDRAKLAVMEARHSSEDEAYTYIRELSRRKAISMEQVANYLLAQLEREP
ncbi:MAG: response regulator [Pseudoflavonifractor sp.]